MNSGFCQCQPVRPCPTVPACVPTPQVTQPSGCTSGSCPFNAQSPPQYYYTDTAENYVQPSYVPPPPQYSVPVPQYVTPSASAYLPTLIDPGVKKFRTTAKSQEHINDAFTRVKVGTKKSTPRATTPRPKPTATRSPKTTPTTTLSEQDILDELYEDDEPPFDLQVADVSARAKDLIPYDIHQKRFHFLRQLKNRLLRQFSAPSVNPRETTNVCNNHKLAKVMVKAMVNDVSISKRLVRRATEMSFNGKKFDVLCAIGDFSYSIYAVEYCEATRGNVTCFAFT
ncbi:ground-like domain-containing protein [Ditylenchus destructor]|nr:ground-like domain-containing protein [Ditylenchus destructor]